MTSLRKRYPSQTIETSPLPLLALVYFIHLTNYGPSTMSPSRSFAQANRLRGHTASGCEKHKRKHPSPTTQDNSHIQKDTALTKRRNKTRTYNKRSHDTCPPFSFPGHMYKFAVFSTPLTSQLSKPDWLSFTSNAFIHHSLPHPPYYFSKIKWLVVRGSPPSRSSRIQPQRTTSHRG